MDFLGKNTETFIGCEAEFGEASAVIFGAPYDCTTSFRPGARFGPSAMRHESFGIETYSPYQDADLEDLRVFDAGDLETPFGDPAPALSMIEETAARIIAAGKMPVMFGGEHLVTLGAVLAAARAYPGLAVIHFDAHADLRDEYLGAKLSHACVLRRCHEILGDGAIHQFCVRSGERGEFAFAASHTDMHKFGFDGLEETIEALRSSGAPVYLTIDLDCLDSGVLPGTGTPEAGGVSFAELVRAVIICGRANIIGADLVELAPMLDASGASTAAACKIARELLLAALNK